MDLSNKAELQALAERVNPIARHAEASGLEWILVGAWARDLLLLANQLDRGPATLDVDIGIAVDSWQDLDRFKRGMELSGQAALHPKLARRLTLADKTPIDLIPFGRIEQAEHIAWPPNGEERMRTSGFQTACEHAQVFILPGAVRVRVPRPAHLLCLKLVAWQERRAERRDAADIAVMLEHADHFMTLEELYGEHAELLESHEYDATETVIDAWGRELARTLNQSTRALLSDLLENELELDSGQMGLIRDMGGQHQRWPSRLRSLQEGLQA